MKKYISYILSAILLLLVMACSRVNSREVPILMYHNVGDEKQDFWTVPTDVFKQQIAWLQESGYTTILPEDIYAYSSEERTLPEKPVLLTFDDGYMSMLDVVEPILEQHGFQGIVYLPTALIGEGEASRKTYERRRCLIWPEVKSMDKRGVLKFGSHSHEHVKLTDIDDPENQLNQSIEAFKKHMAQAPDSFCYPFGAYNKKTVKALEKSNILTAVVCAEKTALIDTHTRLLKLPRLWVRGGDHQFVIEDVKDDPENQKIEVIVCHSGIEIPIVARLIWNKKGRIYKTSICMNKVGDGRFSIKSTYPAKEFALADCQLEIRDKNRFFVLFSGALNE